MSRDRGLPTDSTLGDRRAPDRDQQASRKRDLHRHACRWLAGKELGIDVVDFRKRALVRNEHRRVDDEIRATPSGAQDSIEICERLPCLLGERSAGRFSSLGIDAGLSRNEDESPRAHRLRVRADLGRQAGPCHNFAFHTTPLRRLSVVAIRSRGLSSQGRRV